MTTRTTVTTTMPSTSGHVALAGATVGRGADARQAEDLLDDDRAAEIGAMNCSDSTVSAGGAALRSACLNSTLRVGSPRLRRVRT